MLCGSKLSPMLKRGNCSRSSIRTCRSCCRSNAAATDPAGPAPMMTTSTFFNVSPVSQPLSYGDLKPLGRNLIVSCCNSKTGDDQTYGDCSDQHRQAESLQSRSLA